MAIHKTAMVSSKAEIDTSAEIGACVTIEEGVKIGPGVKIMPNVYIHEGTEIGEGTYIHVGAIIGNDPQDFAYEGAKTFTKIGKNNVIREYVTIHRGTKEGSATVMGDNNMLMVQVHLGHNCKLENNVIVANGAILAGYVEVEKGAFISGNVVFHQFCRVGRYAMIGGFSGVNQDVPPYMLVRGPSYIRGINLVGLRRAGFKRDVIKQIKEAYRIIFQPGRLLKDSLREISESMPSDEIKHLVSFIKDAKRGICKVRSGKEEFFGE